MRVNIGYDGIVINFTSKDVANIVSDFYCDNEVESSEIVRSCLQHFSICPVPTRQSLLKEFIKKHYQGAQLKKVLDLIESCDTEMYSEQTPRRVRIF